MRTSVFVLVGSALALGACEIRVDDLWGRERLVSAVRQSQSEVDWHVVELGDAQDMSAARRELDRHEIAMAAHLSHVRAEVTRLDCDYPGYQALTGLLASIERRLAEYLDDAAAEPALAALPALCDEYVEDLDRYFGMLLDRADAWDCHGW